jgi:hypothetical protein
MVALAARFLPRPPTPSPVASEQREGIDIEQPSESRAVRASQERGRRAAAKNAQF